MDVHCCNGKSGAENFMVRYGIGHWDEMARDERLGLGDKLALAAIEKKRGNQKESAIDPGLRLHPKGESFLMQS